MYRSDTQSLEHSTWTNIPQNQSIGNLAFMGDLYFEKPLGNSKKPFTVIPYINTLSGKDFQNSSSLDYFDYGVDFKIPIANSLNLDATINPDFSQVESDATKIDINSPTAINYPEKRPFFLRGIDAMDYSTNVFYSRSINNPSFASKIIAHRGWIFLNSSWLFSFQDGTQLHYQ